MIEDHPDPPIADRVDAGARDVAIARLQDLYSDGTLSLQRFAGMLEQLFAAPSRAALDAAMAVVPPPIRLTPISGRLTGPLVLRVADNRLQLGSGWQLAADTTINTGLGAVRLDLTAASWDALQVNLHLETWGSIEVLVPEGVAVQMVGGSGSVELEPLSPPVPGGPVLRISTSGPTGVIRVHHPGARHGRPFTRWRRRLPAGGRVPGS